MIAAWLSPNAVVRRRKKLRLAHQLNCMKRTGSYLLVLVAVFGILFLLFFEIDLHCTQKTSFLLATFDFSPHEEEIPVPAVYRHPFAVPLRLYLGAMVGSFILLPAVGGALVARRRITLRRFLLVAAGIAVVHLGNTLIPMTVQGERFSYLNWCALFVGAILLVIAAFAAQLSRPSNADSNVDSGA